MPKRWVSGVSNLLVILFLAVFSFIRFSILFRRPGGPPPSPPLEAMLGNVCRLSLSRRFLNFPINWTGDDDANQKSLVSHRQKRQGSSRSIEVNVGPLRSRTTFHFVCFH